MYASETFGRIFWVDDNYEFKSCPLCIDGTGDFDMEDYVSEWQDWEGVDYNLLLAIHRCELINKVQYKGSILNREAPVVDTFTEELDVKKYIKETEKSNMNTYDEQFYKEIVKDSEFSYGKFNENNYPLHLQQH
jgi:hypothetical protein